MQKLGSGLVSDKDVVEPKLPVVVFTEPNIPPGAYNVRATIIEAVTTRPTRPAATVCEISVPL